MNNGFAILDSETYEPFWPSLEGHLQRALIHDIDADTPAAFREMLDSGEAWVLTPDAGLSMIGINILELNGCRVLNIAACGGYDMPGWIGPTLEVFDRIAGEQQCDSIRIRGRAGWWKWLKAADYTRETVTFCKGL